MGSVYPQKKRGRVNNLYKTNRGLFWLITCIIAGAVWAVFHSSIWAGVIYGAILFTFAVIYEVFFNKHNRTKQ